jgi:hypothetical protein
MFVVASDAENPANYMIGQVTSYSGTSLTFDVTATGGSGTPSSWNVGVAGSPGPTGAQGPSGSLPIAAAGGTANALTATWTGITVADKTVGLVILGAAVTVTNPTLAVNGGTAYTITARGGQALQIGDLPAANFVAQVEYNAANTRWELLNPAPNPPIASKTLLANTSGSSAPAVSTGLSALLDAVFGATRGTTLVRGSSSWAEVGPGSSGQALTSNGTDLVMGTPTNQTITLSGDVSGSGTTGISTSLAGIVGAQTVGVTAVGTSGRAVSFTIDSKGRVTGVSNCNCTTNCDCGC